MESKRGINAMALSLLPTVMMAFLFLGVIVTPGQYYVRDQNLIENGKIYEIAGICFTPTIIAVVILLLLQENEKDPNTKIYGLVHHLLNKIT